jgi:tetratricopeptide (TPR) repeat protein
MIDKEELDKNKKLVKKDIENYILNNMLIEANVLIAEYEKYAKDDIDIYSFKGIIAMMQGDVEFAEEILNKGMLVDSSNIDLLYNIANLYKDMGKSSKAINFYKKMYYITHESDDKKI